MNEELQLENGKDRLRIYPDPILMRRAIPVPNIDGEIKDIADEMIEAMITHQGIGLAAPQIGILRAMTVVGTGEGVRVFINPEVIEGEGESVFEEGCLSLPTVEIPVKRKETILLRAWDLNGKEMNLELSGLTSRVHQHEIDHLHGVLIIHHISQLKRDLLRRKMLKDLKRSRGKGDAL
jgi:peptide deformylase